MALFKKVPHTYTIIAAIILICAVLSWIIPAGEFDRQTVELDGVKRTIIVDDSFHRVEQSLKPGRFRGFIGGIRKAGGNHCFFIDYRRSISDYE